MQTREQEKRRRKGKQCNSEEKYLRSTEDRLMKEEKRKI
jgi:hypothetical protein